MEDCKAIKELIPLYVENELDNQQMKEVIDHCIHCDDCAQELDYYKRYFSLFKGQPLEEAPEDFLEKIQMRLEKPDLLKRIYRFLFDPLPVKIPLGLTGFATAVLCVFVIMRSLSFGSFDTAKSAAEPEAKEYNEAVFVQEQVKDKTSSEKPASAGPEDEESKVEDARKETLDSDSLSQEEEKKADQVTPEESVADEKTEIALLDEGEIREQALEKKELVEEELLIEENLEKQKKQIEETRELLVMKEQEKEIRSNTMPLQDDEYVEFDKTDKVSSPDSRQDQKSMARKRSASTGEDEFAMTQEAESFEDPLEAVLSEEETLESQSGYSTLEADEESEQKPLPVFTRAGYKTIFDYASAYVLGNNISTAALLFSPTLTVQGQTYSSGQLVSHFTSWKEQNPRFATAADLYDTGTVQIEEGNFEGGFTGRLLIHIKAADFFPAFPGQTTCTVFLGKASNFGTLPASINSTLFEGFILKRLAQEDRDLLNRFYSKNDQARHYELTGTPGDSQKQYIVAVLTSLGYYYRIKSITW